MEHLRVIVPYWIWFMLLEVLLELVLNYLLGVEVKKLQVIHAKVRIT